MPEQPTPEYIRPADARLFGLSRSMLYQLMAEGLVESVLVRRPGRARGMRLVRVASLRAYIESHRSEGGGPK